MGQVIADSKGPNLVQTLIQLDELLEGYEQELEILLEDELNFVARALRIRHDAKESTEIDRRQYRVAKYVDLLTRSLGSILTPEMLDVPDRIQHGGVKRARRYNEEKAARRQPPPPVRN